MYARILAFTLLAAQGWMAGAAHAAPDYSPQWLVYAVNQACHIWSDGIARCFPVAMVGPAPTYQGRPLDALMPMAASATPQFAPTWPNPASASSQPGPLPVTTPPTVVQATQPNVAGPLAVTIQTATNASPTPGTDSAAGAPARVAALANPGSDAPSRIPAQSNTMPAKPDDPASTGSQTSPDHGKAPPPQIDATPATPRAERTLTLFDFDQAVLTDTGRTKLDAWLAGLPAGARLHLAGHADRLGPTRYNLALSRRRAESVARYLTGKGIKTKKIKLAAMGERMPLVTCAGAPTPETKACLAPNRRVEVTPE